MDADDSERGHTLGILVEADYVKKYHLRIGGVAILGPILATEAEEAAEKRRREKGEEGEG